MKTAYLEIKTWVGSYCWYATHYYGNIRFGDKKVEIYYKLSAKEARDLNKKETLVPVIAQYKKGEPCSRFSNKDKLIKEGIKTFKKNSHGYDILLEGEHAVCDPMKVLVGPEEIMEKANSLWEQFESFDGWNCKREEEPEVEVISDLWEKVIGVYWDRN